MKFKRKNYCSKLGYGRKIQLKHKLIAFFLIFFAILFFYLKFLVTPIILNNTEIQIKSFATNSINFAIADVMNQNLSYDDLIKVFNDESKNVTHLEANSVRINLLSKTLSKVVMNNFLELSNKPIKIPLGSFSGLSVLSGFGPNVMYEINPFGEVFCSFSSTFESAGINQTYHKIYLVILLSVNVIFPLDKISVDSSSEVLLCETLIVGNIPNTYLNLNALNEMLNLVPEKFSS